MFDLSAGVFFSSADGVREEEKGGGQESESRQTAGPGHAILCL